MKDLDKDALDTRIGKRVKLIDEYGNEDTGVLDYDTKEEAYVLRWWGRGYRLVNDDEKVVVIDELAAAKEEGAREALRGVGYYGSASQANQKIWQLTNPSVKDKS